MAGIDLIPKQYVSRRLLRRRGRQLVAAVLAIVCVVGAARAALWVATSHEQQKAAAEKQLKSLADLRGRGRAALVLEALDSAYLPGVWFDEIRSFRAPLASAAMVDAAAVLRPGAPPQVPPANAAPAAPAPVAVQQRVELVGYAVDHARLASFMTRLSTQPEFGEVQLLDTSARVENMANVVAFKVALAVRDKPRDTKLAAAEGERP